MLAACKTLACKQPNPKKAAARAPSRAPKLQKGCLCMPTGNIPRFTHQAHTYEMPVKNAFTYSLCLATLLFLPIWVQHLTAADGGLTAVGGGKISQEEIFGKTKKKGVVGSYQAHVPRAAIMGNTAICFSLLAIMVSYYGNMKQKQAVAGVYLMWWSAPRHPVHAPWADDPVSMLDMPMPASSDVGRVAIVGTGLASRRQGSLPLSV